MRRAHAIRQRWFTGELPSRLVKGADSSPIRAAVRLNTGEEMRNPGCHFVAFDPGGYRQLPCCRRLTDGGGWQRQLALQQKNLLPARQSRNATRARFANHLLQRQVTPQAAGQRVPARPAIPAGKGWTADQAADAAATGQPGAGCRTANKESDPWFATTYRAEMRRAGVPSRALRRRRLNLGLPR